MSSSGAKPVHYVCVLRSPMSRPEPGGLGRRLSQLSQLSCRCRCSESGCRVRAGRRLRVWGLRYGFMFGGGGRGGQFGICAPVSRGGGTYTRRSKRPGRKSAGSIRSGLQIDHKPSDRAPGPGNEGGPGTLWKATALGRTAAARLPHGCRTVPMRSADWAGTKC